LLGELHGKPHELVSQAMTAQGTGLPSSALSGVEPNSLTDLTWSLGWLLLCSCLQWPLISRQISGDSSAKAQHQAVVHLGIHCD